MSTESKTAISYSLAVSKASGMVLAILKKDKKVGFHVAVGRAMKFYPGAGKRDVITTVNVKIAEARARAKARTTEAQPA